MKNFLLSLNEGVAETDIPSSFLPHFNTLLQLKAIVLKNNLYRFEDGYCAGKLDVSFSGTGYLSSLLPTPSKDIVIEASGLHGGMRGDLVVAKRIANKKKPPYQSCYCLYCPACFC